MPRTSISGETWVDTGKLQVYLSRMQSCGEKIRAYEALIKLAE